MLKGFLLNLLNFRYNHLSLFRPWYWERLWE